MLFITYNMYNYTLFLHLVASAVLFSKHKIDTIAEFLLWWAHGIELQMSGHGL